MSTGGCARRVCRPGGRSLKMGAMGTSETGRVKLAIQPVSAGECDHPRHRHATRASCTRFRSRPGRGGRGHDVCAGGAGTGCRGRTHERRPAPSRTPIHLSQARSACMGRPPSRSSEAGSSCGRRKAYGTLRTSAPHRLRPADTGLAPRARGDRSREPCQMLGSDAARRPPRPLVRCPGAPVKARRPACRERRRT
ncbi:hypothetical protein C8Q80DRAFT_601080 [Daedaleopsis nitida]|nr:hypothetical protein C8Q80DRAFT_601080 [Daedaleopsis nitida]